MDEIDNILKVHSLRPHTLTGHMSLYKNVLHNSNNTFPKWYLECIGVYVSVLNECDYCVNHHFEGIRKLLNDDTKAFALKKALESDLKSVFFNTKRSFRFKIQSYSNYQSKCCQFEFN